MKLKAIVFDLDDTLLDTTRFLIPIARTPAFYERIRKPLPLMDGAKENLDYLVRKYPLYLLTMGNVESQKAKVKSLAIEDYFQDFFFADPTLTETKEQYFKKLVKILKLQPDEFMSIGNRRSTDIREAKLAGGITCLFKYGEHFNEEVLMPEDLPNFEITHHKQLIEICKL